MHEDGSWRLGLSHCYVSLTRSWRSSPPRATIVLCLVEGEKVEYSKGNARKGQDGTPCKYTGFHDIAIVVAEIYAIFSMLIIECSPREQQEEAYNEGEPASWNGLY